MPTDLPCQPSRPTIPFHRPFVTGREAYHVARVIASGRIASDGEYTGRCARFLEERFAIPRVLMTPSCTAALEMAAMLCGLGPGDEVILPSFTFVSTANAVLLRGARPVFVDIRPDTLNIDEARIEAAITPRTRAIFPVHYAGVACEMDAILEVARRRGLLVVEDAAQGVNATYRGRALGSMGDLGTYSFHDTKNIACGEGGALCINRPEFVERAEILRDKGTDRARLLRGEIDKYTWVDRGSSFIPSEITCAYLYGQLEVIDEIARRRRAIFEDYRERLEPFEAEGLLRLPRIPGHCTTHHRTFYILLADGATRDDLIAHLKRAGVSAVFHYVPLHSSPMGLGLGYRPADLPVTEDLSARLLRLPTSVDISEEERAYVVAQVAAFFEAARPPRGRRRRPRPSAPALAEASP